jgi:hypothetical protein
MFVIGIDPHRAVPTPPRYSTAMSGSRRCCVCPLTVGNVSGC